MFVDQTSESKIEVVSQAVEAVLNLTQVKPNVDL